MGGVTQGDAALALGYLLLPPWGKCQLVQPTALGHDAIRLRESVQVYFLSRNARAGCLVSALDRTFELQSACFRIGIPELVGVLLG